MVSKIETALPICTPIPVQWHPWSCPWASNPCSLDITTTTNVRDHDQVEVWLSPQSETNSSSSCARYPSIHAFSKSYFKHTIKKIWNLYGICTSACYMILLPSIEHRNYAFIALSCNAKESRHGHVKMLARRIAPPSIIIWRAEIGGSYRNNCTSEAPLGICPIVAH